MLPTPSAPPLCWQAVAKRSEGPELAPKGRRRWRSRRRWSWRGRCGSSRFRWATGARAVMRVAGGGYLQ